MRETVICQVFAVTYQGQTTEVIAHSSSAFVEELRRLGLGHKARDIARTTWPREGASTLPDKADTLFVLGDVRVAWIGLDLRRRWGRVHPVQGRSSPVPADNEQGQSRLSIQDSDIAPLLDFGQTGGLSE